MVPYPVPIFPLVPIFHSFTYSYNLSNLIELPLIYSRAQLVELERMYECVRIAPNRPKIQVYKNIINHKFIFNYHYNSALWSDRFKSVAIKDPRTAGIRWLVGPNGYDLDRRRFLYFFIFEILDLLWIPVPVQYYHISQSFWSDLGPWIPGHA